MHQSVATISSPQFLNLQPLDINPLMSKCEIKVFYIGQNRNRSFITKEVATEIGKTLRGAPIVGYYRENKEDFTDHGEKVTIDDQGIHFECLTKPYGFVSPDAEVWFQDFEDTDAFGNVVIRTYLMTTGYIWDGQYKEAKSVTTESGKPHSMELDPETLKGSWEYDPKTQMEFFIINDAIMSKLCILGDDVEPCFEGSSIKSPDVSSRFSLDDDFKHTLYSMLQDLRNVLEEGGQHMDDPKTTPEMENEEVNTEFSAAEEEAVENEVSNEESETEIENTESVNEAESSEEEGDNAPEEAAPAAPDHFELLKEIEELKTAYESLNAKYTELVEFKKGVDNKEKDALIAEFYMLSDEDKADVITNKEKYSLADIKAKLSVICFDKKINFTKENNDETQNAGNAEEDVSTYSLNSDISNLPEWVRAVMEEQKNS